MNSIIKIIAEEDIRACKKHGEYFSSDHEAAAVIAEEYEEASKELELCLSALKVWWKLVREDNSDGYKYRQIHLIYSKAMLAACECVQLAQTIFKAGKTTKRRMDGDDSDRD